MPEATVSLERLDLAHDEAPRGDPLDAARGLGVARQRVSQNAPVQQRAVHKRKTHHIVRVPVLRKLHCIVSEHCHKRSSLRIVAVLEDSLHDKIPVIMAGEQRSEGNQLHNERVQIVSREVFQQPLEDAAPNRMLGGLDGAALQLLGDEVNLARRQVDDAGLQQEVRVRACGGRPDVALELPGNRTLVVGLGHLDGLLQRAAPALLRHQRPRRLQEPLEHRRRHAELPIERNPMLAVKNPA
mmetsp:Transcript_42577/g.128668  ORF Transcript_42577/g.128668 Transcript_42577/m.128668 type:complete len:241 (+) Transcript_42577:299-1021(+)